MFNYKHYLQGRKISGTAAKLTRDKSYHHCTLLVNADRTNLSNALKNPHTEIIHTNATQSVRSPVDNLLSADSNITIDKVENALAQHYKSDTSDIEYFDENTIDTKDNEFINWNWIFGKTPKFFVKENILLEDNRTVCVEITVVKGHISSISINNAPIDIEIRSDMKFESKTILDIAQRLRNTEKEVMLALLKRLNLFV